VVKWIHESNSTDLLKGMWDSHVGFKVRFKVGCEIQGGMGCENSLYQSSEQSKTRTLQMFIQAEGI
jgi:hypothetical protein